VEGRYVTSLGWVQPPVIARSEVVGGVMKYKVVAQLMIALEGQGKKIAPQTWDITVIIERVGLEKSVNGIAISSIAIKAL
jgi:hypothetical protein